jgi:hypothetical protein
LMLNKHYFQQYFSYTCIVNMNLVIGLSIFAVLLFEQT